MMSERMKADLMAFIGGWLIMTAIVGTAKRSFAGEANPWTVDFRYAPPWWQTSICLPDDWQKTLVAKDGGLLYDYRGRFADFKTKITAGFQGETEWVRQELLSPRVPIVRTIKRNGQVELLEEAFAVAPSLRHKEPPNMERPVVERLGEETGLVGWASPKVVCDPAFKNIAVGWGQPIRYRFRTAGSAGYAVVLGLCEGYHQQGGQRLLDLQIEGKRRKTVDIVAAKGQNMPVLFAFDARDEDGDGWIEVAVSAAEGSPDVNAILNVLWVFEGTMAPPKDELLAGRSSRAPLLHVDCGTEQSAAAPPRNDMLILRLRNTGSMEASVTPTVSIESEFAVTPDKAKTRVLVGAQTTLVSATPFEQATRSKDKVTLQFPEVRILPGEQRVLAVGVGRGRNAPFVPQTVSDAEAFLKRAERYWLEVDLPYKHIEVPDAGVQALVDSAIRNIYQAREIKKGLPAFQVGPTCYRGLWVVDGSFLMEAVAYLGRQEEARNGIRYLLSFQRDDGAFMLIDGHWKETGIALWAVSRHARLAGDKNWLQDVWPSVERGFAFIQKMRKMASADPAAPNAGLIPEGFSDGGLAGRYPEYTNVYWTLAGMRSAVEAARWLEKNSQADEWQRKYNDFYATFRRAAKRDMRTDAHGNCFLPIRMRDDENVAPQKAQWAFLHAVFPGKVFVADDPLVRGNMAMLQSVEREGLVYGTGWLSEGIWNYFGSFYAHAWLWIGDGQKAARTLYAFANHASPLLCWREEQMPLGKGQQVCGDMPHNWASAEFIRLVRHLLVLERGNELHLFEGLPAKWIRPGAVARLRGILTEFGPMSLDLHVADDGSSAHLKLNPPRQTVPARIVLHLERWSGRKGTIELPTKGSLEKQIRLDPLASP